MKTTPTYKEIEEEQVRKFCNALASNLKPSNDTMEVTRLLKKELPSFAKTIRDATARACEVHNKIAPVDEEFLKRKDAEEYIGEWSINMDRKRIRTAQRENYEKWVNG